MKKISIATYKLLARDIPLFDTSHWTSVYTPIITTTSKHQKVLTPALIDCEIVGSNPTAGITG